MAQRSATLGFFLLLSTAVACDTAGEHDGCVDGVDPSECPRSLFPAQQAWMQNVAGLLRRGEDGVAGALVRVTSAEGSSTNFTAGTSTDEVGAYRVLDWVPSVYDLSFVIPNGPDRRSDVFVLRGVSYRYLEPQLDVAGRSLPRSWIGHVQVQLDAPLAEGHSVLFLAAGDGVYGVTGDLQKGLDVHTAKYEQRATIRAVEYDAAKGLISASAYGKADVISDAGTASSVTLHLEPITANVTPEFSIDLPPGFVPGAVEIRVASSRTSDALLASIPWGQSMTLPLVPDQGYTYHLRATRADGAVSDSGEVYFDPAKPALVSLPAPPEPLAPEDGATFGAGDPISSRSDRGILENVFEPQTAGAPALRVVTTKLDTTLPDLHALNVEKGVGSYTWTVRRYSTMTVVENVWGADARRYRPVAISAPRTLILR